MEAEATANVHPGDVEINVQKNNRLTTDWRNKIDRERRLCRMDKDITSYKLQLQKNCEKYKMIETRLYQTEQLKTKALFLLNDMNEKNEALNESLKAIHNNYEGSLKIVGKPTNTAEVRANALKVKRDRLQNELETLQKAETNLNKELADFEKMVSVEQKKHTALLRKLRKASENDQIPREINERIRTILNEPISTQTTAVNEIKSVPDI